MFAKLAVFAFIVSFIFLFVVYGYRFDGDTRSFVTQNVSASANFFSENGTLLFDGNIYEAHDHQINFYNLEPGCYNVNFAGNRETVCYENNNLYIDAFVKYSGTKPYARATFDEPCEPVVAVEREKYSVGKQSFANPIQSAFRFHNISFVQVADTLYSCNSDYSNCKELAPVQGDVVCGNDQ